MNKQNKQNKQARREARKEAALKKARNKKIIAFAVIALIVICLIALIILLATRQSGNRVYENGNQTVILKSDGSFTANLAHEVTKSGTYNENESEENGIITVSFVTDGSTAEGTISNNILTIPDEWSDGHGHGTTFRLK